MPYFSQRSHDRLKTCHPELQRLLHTVIQHTDFTVLEGHRTTERQQELFAQGRTAPGRIVTYVDGVTRTSKHQTDPSIAVDIAPWPVDWDDTDGFHELAGWIQAFAFVLGIGVQWGGHWQRFKDLPHWELDDEREENPHQP